MFFIHHLTIRDCLHCKEEKMQTCQTDLQEPPTVSREAPTELVDSETFATDYLKHLRVRRVHQMSQDELLFVKEVYDYLASRLAKNDGMLSSATVYGLLTYLFEDVRHLHKHVGFMNLNVRPASRRSVLELDTAGEFMTLWQNGSFVDHLFVSFADLCYRIGFRRSAIAPFMESIFQQIGYGTSFSTFVFAIIAESELSNAHTEEFATAPVVRVKTAMVTSNSDLMNVLKKFPAQIINTSNKKRFLTGVDPRKANIVTQLMDAFHCPVVARFTERTYMLYDVVFEVFLCSSSTTVPATSYGSLDAIRRFMLKYANSDSVEYRVSGYISRLDMTANREDAVIELPCDPKQSAFRIQGVTFHGKSELTEKAKIPPSVTTRLTETQMSAVRVSQQRSTVDMASFMQDCLVDMDGRRYYIGTKNISYTPLPSGRHGICVNLNTGAGKTLTCVAAFLGLGLVKPMLVVVPPVAINHWGSEIKKHTTLEVGVSFDRHHAICISETKELARTVFTDKMRILVVTPNVINTKNFGKYVPKAYSWLAFDEVHKMKVKSSSYKELVSNITYDFVMAITATTASNAKSIISIMTEGVFENSSGWTSTVPLLGSCRVHGHVTMELEVDTAPVIVEDDKEIFMRLGKHFNNINYKYQHLSGSLSKCMRIAERVCAAGVVDIDLIDEVYRINMSSTAEVQRMRSTTTIEAKEPPPTKTFSTANDDCSVCLSAYDDPVQTVCGHVACRNCLVALINMSRARCPECRTDFSRPVKIWTPSFIKKRDRGAEDTSKGKDEKTGELDKDQFKNIMKGPMAGGQKLSGKSAAFERELSTYMSTRPDGGKLVLYVKAEVPALEYIDILNRSGLIVETCGFGGKNRKESLASIDRFKEDKKVDVLISNFSYCESIDLCMASHLFVMDFDKTMYRLIQSIGRITRIGQLHSKVFVRIFMYKYGIDSYLYEYMGKGRYTANAASMKALEMHMCLEAPDTDLNTAFKIVKHYCPNLTFDTFKDRCDNDLHSIHVGSRHYSRAEKGFMHILRDGALGLDNAPFYDDIHQRTAYFGRYEPVSDMVQFFGI